MTLSTIAHEALCLVLLYTVFCRLVHADVGTLASIRAAFIVLGVVACLGIVAPLLGVPPSWFSLALLGSIVLLQLVTAHHWRDGVPPAFRCERPS